MPRTTQPDQTQDTSLTRARRRRHLRRLLDTRAALAKIAAERASHGYDDAEEAFLLTLGVEVEIEENFPDVYRDRFDIWITTDRQLRHARDTVSDTCDICRTLTSSRWHHLTAPDAA